MKPHLDYILYALIGALTAAQAVETWDIRALIGVALAGIVALKAKRSGSNGNEAETQKRPRHAPEP